MEDKENQFTCPECDEIELIEMWEDPLARGYQCLKSDCQSFDVLEEF